MIPTSYPFVDIPNFVRCRLNLFALFLAEELIGNNSALLQPVSGPAQVNGSAGHSRTALANSLVKSNTALYSSIQAVDTSDSNCLSPTKGSFVSPVMENSGGSFAYRDPRLPAGWWVSVEQLGGELRHGYHSPRGDRLRSPSEVAHYLQACVPSC